MSLTSSQTQAYLRRIGLDRAPAATLEGLADVQAAHMQRVPFENLDVFLRRPLSTDVVALHRKIVEQHRGGYCFELNTQYGRLLQALGFKAQRVMARVWLRDPAKTPTRNHLAWLVYLDGRRYLTDVGFGGMTSRIPVDINAEEPSKDADGPIRVIPDEHFGYMLERGTATGEWHKQYSFDLSSVADQDVECANHWMQTHPKSHFREARFVGLFTKEGRNGLFDQNFTCRVGKKRREEEIVYVSDLAEIQGQSPWLDTLRDQFGIELSLTSDERLRLLSV